LDNHLVSYGSEESIVFMLAGFMLAGATQLVVITVVMLEWYVGI
jgi:hypothetical protein